MHVAARKLLQGNVYKSIAISNNCLTVFFDIIYFDIASKATFPQPISTDSDLYLFLFILLPNLHLTSILSALVS